MDVIACHGGCSVCSVVFGLCLVTWCALVVVVVLSVSCCLIACVVALVVACVVMVVPVDGVGSVLIVHVVGV